SGPETEDQLFGRLSTQCLLRTIFTNGVSAIAHNLINMVDVRELLRNELASRRTSSSKAGKKRKHGPDVEPARKKTKPYTKDKAQDDSEGTSDVIEPPLPTGEPGLNKSSSAESEQEPELDTEEQPTIPTITQPVNQDVDEDEWAAFEREVAQPSRQQPAFTRQGGTLNNNATISAAPVSAAELESRERQDREAVAKNREAALLGDREDATRSLEEEFDEMEELDQRVQRLKQMRDEIRRKREAGERALAGVEADPPNDKTSADEQVEAEDDEDEDDGEGWDDWGFR
ncbi:hypothetical protein FQN49_003346, partial [Arthroderma sp. PD_2]